MYRAMRAHMDAAMRDYRQRSKDGHTKMVDQTTPVDIHLPAPEPTSRETSSDD